MIMEMIYIVRPRRKKRYKYKDKIKVACVDLSTVLFQNLEDTNLNPLAFHQGPLPWTRASDGTSVLGTRGNQGSFKLAEIFKELKQDGRCGPGINHCDFGEEETTNALHKLHQLHAPNRHSDAPAQFHQHQRLTAAPYLGKKNENESGDASNLKSNVKRLADQEGFRVSIKMKSERLYHGFPPWCSHQRVHTVVWVLC